MQAFIFPGQGSQQLGMLATLAESHPEIKETFVEASDLLGFDVWAMSQSGPEAALNSTENTQPILLTASVALFRLWQAQGFAEPALLAGHSLGEYTALVCADAVDFSAAVQLVRERGLAMQAAVPANVGAMAAIIGLEAGVLEQICDTQSGSGMLVSCANFNCPGQIVVAGHKAAVNAVIEAANAAGARLATLLPVSVPSHCALMEPAVAALTPTIQGLAWREPRIPVISNVTAQAHSDVAQLPELLLAQLASPVLWQSSIEHMRELGVSEFFECGPGRVLTGLNKRIDRQLVTTALETPAAWQALAESSS
jgi:[acyl-carrier-protein] S-malonyltransferase